jgi:hypothetical protein
MIELVTGEELAQSLGYSGVNNAFRDWCSQMRITPVPGRRGFYDPKLVRARLDEAQGLVRQDMTSPTKESFVAIRRARRGKN